MGAPQQLLVSAGAASSAPAITYTATAFNPNDKSSLITLSLSDLKATYPSGAAHGLVRALIGKRTGKWYFEVTANVLNTDADWNVGLTSAQDVTNTYAGSSALTFPTNSMGMFPDWTSNIRTYKNGVATDQSGYGRVSAAGQSVAVAIDFDAGKCWFRKNGSGWIGGGDPAAGTSPTYTFTANTHLVPTVNEFRTGLAVTANFGGSAFAGTIPSGYTAWQVATPPAQPVFVSRYSAPSNNDIQCVYPAPDGVHDWVTDSTHIYKIVKATGSVAASRLVTSDNPTSKSQINGIIEVGGVLYVAAAENSSPRKSWIVQYTDLTLASGPSAYNQITGDWFMEGLAMRPGDTTHLWACFHATKQIAQIDMSTWTVTATHDLTLRLTGSSGGYGSGTGYDGLMWYTAPSGAVFLAMNIHDTYDQDGAHIYRDNLSGSYPFEDAGRWTLLSTGGHQGFALEGLNTLVLAERIAGGDKVARFTIT